jgi:hypothetical protein
MLQQVKGWVGKTASEGLEPPTLGSEDRCSNPLSYEANGEYNIMKQVVDFGNITNLDTVLSPATPVKKRGLEYGF